MTKDEPTMSEVIAEYAKEVDELHRVIGIEVKTREQVQQARYRVQVARQAIRDRENEILEELNK